VIIILASRYDQAARLLAERWAAHDATLLTAQDLSASGWNFQTPAWGSGQAVAGGRVIANDRITGVLTRLAGIDPAELDHVAPEDAAYIASEMTAFLVAWLSTLSCPVLNRPAPECLCGPTWRTERWIRVAAGLGIPVQFIHRDSRNDSTPGVEHSSAGVTVVGERCFGSVDVSLANHSRRLAASAGVGLMEVRFTSPERDGQLVRVNLCPDVSAAGVGQAVIEYFAGAAVC
jgi:hypothetical protein